MLVLTEHALTHDCEFTGKRQLGLYRRRHRRKFCVGRWRAIWGTVGIFQVEKSETISCFSLFPVMPDGVVKDDCFVTFRLFRMDISIWVKYRHLYPNSAQMTMTKHGISDYSTFTSSAAHL